MIACNIWMPLFKPRTASWWQEETWGHRCVSVCLCADGWFVCEVQILHAVLVLHHVHHCTGQGLDCNCIHHSKQAHESVSVLGGWSATSCICMSV